VQGERYLQHQEAEAEVIDYTANATTVSPNTFQIPSHINGVNLWVEIDGPTVKVKEAQNGDVLKISDLGSSMEGGFDATYQRFVGEFNLAYTSEAEVIDYTANATTVSPNTFQIPSHINGVNLWVEIDGPTVKVKEAQNGDVLKISDLGSSMEGGFDATYQRFVGEFNLAYTYEAEGGTHEAHTRLKFDL